MGPWVGLERTPTAMDSGSIRLRNAVRSELIARRDQICERPPHTLRAPGEGRTVTCEMRELWSKIFKANKLSPPGLLGPI